MSPRKTLHTTLLWTVLTMLTAGCGSSTDEPNLNHYAVELTDSVSFMHTAVAAHHDEVLRQTDLARIPDLERLHSDSMNAQMGRVQDALDSMGACLDHTTQPDQSAQHKAVASLNAARTSMHGSMQGGLQEMQHHSQAMAAAPDLEAALAEEHRHQGAMDGIMMQMTIDNGDVDEAVGSMHDAGMSMMCSMMRHMHQAA